jgi:hypothetical protein
MSDFQKGQNTGGILSDPDLSIMESSNALLLCCEETPTGSAPWPPSGQSGGGIRPKYLNRTGRKEWLGVAAAKVEDQD